MGLIYLLHKHSILLGKRQMFFKWLITVRVSFVIILYVQTFIRA